MSHSASAKTPAAPTISLPGTKSRYDDLDIITVRENKGGMYSGEGQTVSDDGQRAEALSVITREQCERIIKFAFEMARARGRNSRKFASKRTGKYAMS